MKRRTFLKNTAAASFSLPLLLHGNKLSAISRHALFNGMNQDSDRVIVLIQLNGGNDGLNMVLPLDQYSNLFTARENILIPENQALQLSLETGLHPAMTHLKTSFDEGRLSVIQNVGYPDQNRSHFRSTDIWQTGSSANEVINTGWAGRFFDSYVMDYPEGYPNASYPDPFAITVGSIISETCQGFAANYSLALEDPFGISPLLEDDDNNTDPTVCYGKEINFVRTAIAQTNAYGTVISEAASKGTNLVTYPAANRLAQQLKTIALLISGGLKTRIYVASLGGFDTHANQVDATDTTTGGHANLMATLSEAIGLFQSDLVLQKLDKRVVGMTFSEFGRRIRSNGANGTDHGSAAPLFIFGSCVKPGIIGANPTINDTVDEQEGVAMQFDFRSVYGSLLKQWFEVPLEDVQTLLYSDFSEIPLIEGCTTTSTEQNGGSLQVNNEFFNTPNPFSASTRITFSSNGERVYLSVFNAAGYEMKVLIDRYLEPGRFEVTLDAGILPAGNYFAHLRTPSRQLTHAMVHIR
jgi:uncharacterized protein (DUF1501 family)